MIHYLSSLILVAVILLGCNNVSVMPGSVARAIFSDVTEISANDDGTLSLKWTAPEKVKELSGLEYQVYRQDIENSAQFNLVENEIIIAKRRIGSNESRS